MSSRTRDNAGRFTSGTSSNSLKSFDLRQSLEGLFQRAEKNGDYTGAASIARVLRELALEEKPRNPDDINIDDLLDAEVIELTEKLDWFTEFKGRVRARQQRTSPTPPAR